MIGAIAGDIIGSVFEFNNYKAKDFSPLFMPNSKFTDDTVCTVAIADSLLNNKTATIALKEWGHKYWSNGGWGKQFAFWLASKDSLPYNSWGNGAAMRVSSCAWLAKDYDEAMSLALKVTEVTHNHPEGIKGSQATVSAIYWALHGVSKKDIRQQISDVFHYDLSRNVDDIRKHNPHSEACQKTVPEAITCALESVSFEDAIRNAISIGGDSDTIAAITGSIAEAMYGIPDEIKDTALSKLPKDMLEIVKQYQDYFKKKPTNLELVNGNLMDFDADFIVNASNTNLMLGSGVSMMFKRHCGVELQREMDAIIKSMESKNEHIKQGDVVATSSANAKNFQYALHAAVISYEKGKTQDERKPTLKTISTILNNTLPYLEWHNEKYHKPIVIVFPYLGCGAGGLNKHDVLNVFKDFVKTEVSFNCTLKLCSF